MRKKQKKELPSKYCYVYIPHEDGSIEFIGSNRYAIKAVYIAGRYRKKHPRRSPEYFLIAYLDGILGHPFTTYENIQQLYDNEEHGIFIDGYVCQELYEAEIIRKREREYRRRTKERKLQRQAQAIAISKMEIPPELQSKPNNETSH